MEFCNHKFLQQPRYNIVYCNDVSNGTSNSIKDPQLSCSRGAQTPTASNHGSEVLTLVGRMSCNGGLPSENVTSGCESNVKGLVHQLSYGYHLCFVFCIFVI